MMLGNQGRVAVEVEAESVEIGAGCFRERLVEPRGSLPSGADNASYPHPPEHDERRRVCAPHGAGEQCELVRVLRRVTRPEKIGVAHLVVALPVAHAAGEPPDERGDETLVGDVVECGGWGLEVGGHPRSPRRTRTHRHPGLVGRIELRGELVDDIPDEFAGPRFDLGPVEVDPHEAGAEVARLLDPVIRRAEEAVRDSANDAERGRWMVHHPTCTPNGGQRRPP